MNTLAHPPAIDRDAADRTSPPLTKRTTPWWPVAGYALTVLACVLGGLVAGAVAQPTPRLAADTELTWLLRGMGLIKASLIVAALGALAVRLRWSLPGPLAWGYGACLALLTASTVLIWHLSWIPLAAAVFHIAGLVLLVLAWRDGAGLWDAHRRAASA